MWLIRKLKQRWKWSRITKHNTDLDEDLERVWWIAKSDEYYGRSEP